MKAALHIDRLIRAYGEVRIVRDISFDVAAGEFFIIIGPNGSGKTTLLKTLAGIDSPQGGSVTVFGRAIDRYPRKELAKTLAFVPQNMPLDFPYTVMQTVLMGRHPHLGVLGFEAEKDIQLAHQALAFAGVTHLSARTVDRLSGGERQRVFIARALCQEPRLLLLDEPTASLDLAHQVRVMDLMARLKRETGMTVVMVSHDVNLAAMYADRLMLLNSGQIAALGTPRQVMTFETLESVYGCPLLVDESPLDRLPRITLVPSRFLWVMKQKEQIDPPAPDGCRETDHQGRV